MSEQKEQKEQKLTLEELFKEVMKTRRNSDYDYDDDENDLELGVFE